MKKLVSVLLIVVMVFASGCGGGAAGESLDELLSLGQKYLLEENYKEAIVAFEKAIKIDGKCVDAYLGLADAYLGLGDIDSAQEILKKGYDVTGDERLREMSQSKIAGHEPRKLFDNPLLANEVTFAGIPFWHCSLEDVQRYYPEGIYTYKDSEGIIRDLEGAVLDGSMSWDTNYSTFGDNGDIQIQYSTEGTHRYAGFYGVSEIRGLSMGMDLDSALDVLGFSSVGTVFVKETGGGSFDMDESGCYSAGTIQSDEDDYVLHFHFYDKINDKSMGFTVSFKDGGIRLIEIMSD